MPEPKKQQIGDGSDNFANAASNVSKAVRQAGQKAASDSAEAAASGAMKAGGTAANIAKGTAAGGPWGAVLAAAWSMRHTLYKILICVCLSLVFLIVFEPTALSSNSSLYSSSVISRLRSILVVSERRNFSV